MQAININTQPIQELLFNYPANDVAMALDECMFDSIYKEAADETLTKKAVDKYFILRELRNAIFKMDSENDFVK